MVNKKTILLGMFFIIILNIDNIYSQENRNNSQTDKNVETYIKEEMKKFNIPGLSLLVIKNGKVIKQQAYGLANYELNVPATIHTIYQIASASKPFTAVAIMLLAEEEKLKLDDTIQALLPGLPELWKGITVKNLLTHTSGLPDIAVHPGKLELIADTRDEAMKKLALLPLQGKPGEKWSYNQTNYLLLRMILEKISGMSLPDFMRQRFFQPLGMNSTFYANAEDIVKGRASNYQATRDGKLLNRWMNFPEYTFASAGINTTVLDWGQWTEALVQEKMIKPSTLELMCEPVKLNDGKTFLLDSKRLGYGFGFLIDNMSGHKSIGHSGGGTAAFRCYLDDKITIIVEMNGNVNPDKLLNHVAELYIPDLSGVK